MSVQPRRSNPTEITRSAYLAQTPEQFTHDADGNLTVDGKWTYTWDAENRLTRMEVSAPMARGGLLGRYFNYTAGTVWSGPAALERVETVDFDWGRGQTGSGLGVWG